MIHILEATTARAARSEALKFAPCKLHGFTSAAPDAECVYMTTVRRRGDKAPVATATNERGKATFFKAYTVDL